MTQHGRRVVHPDWVVDAEKGIHASVDSYKRGAIPQSIEMFMLVAPVRRFLRGIYGGNWRALWALLLWTCASNIRDLWQLWVIPFWHLKVLRKDREQWFAELDERAGAAEQEGV